MRVDSHHHIWHYTPQEFGWIDEPMRSLRRDFLPADLKLVARPAGIDATIAVQARQTLEETAWLLEVARDSDIIRGVVGWAPIAAHDFQSTLDVLAQDSQLKGLRHVVQAEPPGFLDDAAFNRGIAAILASGLVYDVLIFARQLDETIRFIDRHPKQSFVLDHIAKPAIRAADFATWDKAVRELARRSNVVCKLSGMVTEADWQTWSPAELQPYFDTVLEAFGPSRLMFGSDWPVLTVASSYARWFETANRWTASLTPTERAQIEGGTAARIYQLSIAKSRLETL